MKETQILILGGGCAGLSLAKRLAQSSSDARAVVVEPRIEYGDDRTWCFWEGQYMLPEALPLHSWPCVALSNESKSIIVDVSERPYQMLRSKDFYADALNCIRTRPNIELWLETSALSSIQLQSGRWKTETSKGSIESDVVIDTRPFAMTPTSQPTIWQSFLGQEIECTGNVFDASKAHLMDFLKSNRYESAFAYILPTSSTRALVELTVLSEDRLLPSELITRLNDAITARTGGSPYRILREEYGTIPMGISSVPSPNDSYVRVGVGAGSARASSGYTFCRLQGWADHCAKSLSSRGLPVGPIADSRLVQFMDHVFLKVLRANPSLAPQLFVDLFDKVPARRLLRFLSDSPTLVDALAIVAALPKLPFLRECFKSSEPRAQQASEAT
ncbi:MAG: lycopene cyclase family protein [Fimbriimonas sp.]